MGWVRYLKSRRKITVGDFRLRSVTRVAIVTRL